VAGRPPSLLATAIETPGTTSMSLGQAATLNQRQGALRIAGQTVHGHGQNYATYDTADKISLSAFSF